MTQSPPALQDWITTVTEGMPHLSKPQALVLAWWSFGIMLAPSGGLTSVAAAIAQLLDLQEHTVRQRLREFDQAASDKKGEGGKGPHRHDLEVTLCFPAWMRWGLRSGPARARRVALAMDATTLASLFTVLAIRRVYRGCAMPVAWFGVRATTPGSWKPHWRALFPHLSASLPAEWTGIVLADRGLSAKWLYRAIQHQGGHPFLRITAGGKYRREPTGADRLLSERVPNPGDDGCNAMECFKRNPLACTRLARHAAPHTDAWWMVTDLAPAHAAVCGYAVRAWIERGFKDTQRGGGPWQPTQITDPARAARHW